MNKLLLRLALLPKGIWKGVGADVDQLRAILEVKLKMDDRKPLSFGRQRQQKKDRKFTSVMGMFVSLMTGLMYIFPLIFISDRILAITTFFSLFLFMLTFTLITDFSNVLIDTRDKYIILPKPVNDRTLLMSRVLHIFIYLFRIVLPMALPGWIALGIMNGWTAALWLPIPLFLLTLTSLFMVMGVYLIMLRLSTAEKFKEILSYFQIAFSIFIFAFYYLGNRMWVREDVLHIDPQQFLWARWLPSYWLAATYTWIHPHAGLPGTMWLSVLAVLLPLAAIYVTIKFLAPRFAQLLGGLDAVEGAPGAGGSMVKRSRAARAQKLAALLNKRPEAEAGFLMAWVQTARSRSFKMKVYPMFAYVPIYFVYLMMLDKRRPLAESWHDMPNTSRHLALMYMCSIVIMQALSFMTVSDQYKAAWIYEAVPLREPGSIMAGAFKAMWVKYFLPFFGTVAIFVLVVWGPGVWSDVLLAGVNATLFAVVIARVAYRRFPFSGIEQMNASGSRFLRVFVSLMIPGLMGFGHYMAIHLLWLKLIFLGLSSILLWLAWDSYSKTAWSGLQRFKES